jgi:hypothetical protein
MGIPWVPWVPWVPWEFPSVAHLYSILLTNFDSKYDQRVIANLSTDFEVKFDSCTADGTAGYVPMQCSIFQNFKRGWDSRGKDNRSHEACQPGDRRRNRPPPYVPFYLVKAGLNILSRGADPSDPPANRALWATSNFYRWTHWIHECYRGAVFATGGRRGADKRPCKWVIKVTRRLGEGAIGGRPVRVIEGLSEN